jgi:septum formation protein
MTTEDSEKLSFIYLASSSPRRQELLSQLGLRFEVLAAAVDESVRDGESGADYVGRLAAEKSAAALPALAPGAPPVLAADTAVEIDRRILGKPADESDAERMLTLLSGRTHEVLTAVSVRDNSRNLVEISRSRVRFRAISAPEIARYWQSGEPAGKAGAYAIQGLGAVFVEELSGSYTGVMGLPLYETAHILNKFGYRVF